MRFPWFYPQAEIPCRKRSNNDGCLLLVIRQNTGNMKMWHECKAYCVLYNHLLLPCFLWSHESLFWKYMLICLFTLQTAGSVKCIFTPCCFWTWRLWHPNLTSVKRANHNSASEREKKVCEELVSASSTGWSHPCCLCTKKEFSA